MMRRYFSLLLLVYGKALLASEGFSETHLNAFYDVYLSEAEAIVSEVFPEAAQNGSTPFPPPVPPPPPPPVNPLDPAPKAGYLPVVIANTTTLDDDQVYVLLAGQQTPSDLTQYFFELKRGGVMSPVKASASTFSANYSYPLSSLPRSSTGEHEFLVYVSSLNGARFYFSVGSPIYLQSDVLTGNPPNQIVAPTYYAFYDPNYSNLFESVEITFFPKGGQGGSSIPWTATVNSTEVDAFCLPIRIGYFSYDASNPSAVTPLIQNPNALPSGFGVGGAVGATKRSQILTNVVSGLTSGDLTGASPLVWPRLAIPFYSNPYAGSGLQTYLRVLSPKQSVGNAANPAETGGLTPQHLPSVQPGPVQFKNYNYPPFPIDYLTGTTYGDTNSFATDLFNYYSGNTNLYLSTGGQTPTVYRGTATGSLGNQTLTFTGTSGPNTGDTSTLQQSDLNTFKMYSGSQLMSGGADSALLGFYFGDAFTVGFLPSPVGTASTSTPPNIPINITDAVTWQPTFIPSYYQAQYSLSGGPWMDLYAKLLHAVAVRNSVSGDLNNVGLCYGYDFDDSLGISGAITPTISTSASLNPYLGITLGEVDTSIPDPYSDPNSYTVVFTYPTGNTVQYQQGSGPWTTISFSGQSVPGLYSNRANPLRIRYTNNQGSFAYHEFIVYLYYQFLQPTITYNSSDVSVINSTTVTPNSATPTQFTIALLP